MEKNSFTAVMAHVLAYVEGRKSQIENWRKLEELELIRPDEADEMTRENVRRHSVMSTILKIMAEGATGKPTVLKAWENFFCDKTKFIDTMKNAIIGREHRV